MKGFALFLNCRSALDHSALHIIGTCCIRRGENVQKMQRIPAQGGYGWCNKLLWPPGHAHAWFRTLIIVVPGPGLNRAATERDERCGAHSGGINDYGNDAISEQSESYWMLRRGLPVDR